MASERAAAAATPAAEGSKAEPELEPEPPPLQKGKWEWQSGSSWKEYLPADQDTLESAWQAKRSGPVVVNGGKNHIIFEFNSDGSNSAVRQIGRKTDGSDDFTRQRAVRRIEITARSRGGSRA